MGEGSALKQEFWKVWLVDYCVLVARGYVVPRSYGGTLWSVRYFTLNLSLVHWGWGLGAAR